MTGGVGAQVETVATSPDERLVAIGSYDGVRDLSSLAGMHSKYNSYSWYVFGTFAPVDCWRHCRDTVVACGVRHSPPRGVDW